VTEPRSPDEVDRAATSIFGLTIAYVALYAGAVYLWIFL
jgi:hypothetical protein